MLDRNLLRPSRPLAPRHRRAATTASALFLLVGLILPAAAVAEIELISKSSFGEPGRAASYQPAISGDGRFVAFVSDASNLVPDDPDNWYFGVDPDVFIHDRQTGTTENASAALNAEGLWFLRTVCRDPSIDAVGRFVAFECFSGWHFAHRMNFDIYLVDRQTQTFTKITAGFDGRKANGGSTGAALSSDGRYLAFASSASNLLALDSDTLEDVYIYDRETGGLELASVATDGVKGNGRSSAPALSGDGRFVAFVSAATNLGNDGSGAAVYVRDRQTGTTEKVPLPAGMDGTCAEPAISGVGATIAFTITTPDGGRTVLVANRGDGSVRPLAAGAAPSLSADGRHLAFAGANGILLHDLASGQSKLISGGAGGEPANAASTAPSLSAHGQEVAFASWASNLSPADTNGSDDVFVYRHTADTTPPTVALAVSPTLLWPPNKKYVPVLVAGSAEDETELAAVEITVTDEYGEMLDRLVPGFDSTVWLEAWREGNDFDGRVYTIRAVAVDAAGNRSETETRVVVPHDMRNKR